jgi:hypothetical protein
MDGLANLTKVVAAATKRPAGFGLTTDRMGRIGGFRRASGTPGKDAPDRVSCACLWRLGCRFVYVESVPVVFSGVDRCNDPIFTLQYNKIYPRFT